MHKRTKACMIPKKVKEKVIERDDHKCVLCGRHAPIDWACAHFIARSHGGLGTEQNIVTLCPECHRRYDQTSERENIRATLQGYLLSKYEEIDLADLIYRKGET